MSDTPMSELEKEQMRVRYLMRQLEKTREHWRIFNAHRGECWDWIVEEDDLSEGCNAAAGMDRVLKMQVEDMEEP